MKNSFISPKLIYLTESSGKSASRRIKSRIMDLRLIYLLGSWLYPPFIWNRPAVGWSRQTSPLPRYETCPNPVYRPAMSNRSGDRFPSFRSFEAILRLKLEDVFLFRWLLESVGGSPEPIPRFLPPLNLLDYRSSLSVGMT